MVFGSEGRAGLRRYNGRACFVASQTTDSAATYIIVPGEADDPNSLGLLSTYFPSGQVVEEGPLHYGAPYFIAYQIPPATTSLMTPSQPLSANWADRIGLLGFDLDKTSYRPGNTIHLTLYYEPLADMDENYTAFTQLLGETNPATGGPVWGQNDSEPCERFYPTSAWHLGEIVQDHFAIAIPPETPPGEYELRMGFYAWPSLERLPVVDEAGTTTGDSALLATVVIAPTN